MGLFGFGKKKSCPVCGMEEKKGEGLEKDDKWYCSEDHAKQGEKANKCATCNTPRKEGSGVWYCSEDHAKQGGKSVPVPAEKPVEHPMGAQPATPAQPAEQAPAETPPATPPQQPQQAEEQKRVEY